MADIVLVQPKIGIEGYSSYGLVPPWGLIYSSVLVHKEYDVKIIDQRVDRKWDKTLLMELKKDPLCVGVTSKAGSMVRNSLKISQFVKQNSDVAVVWGGPLASIIPEKTLENENIDVVVVGEGEVTFYELIKALDEKRTLKGIRGLWYKDKGVINSNPERDFVDLNTLPELPLHLVDLREYIFEIDGLRTIYLLSSRGCPRKCKFCYNNVFNKSKWRTLTSEKTIEFMKHLSDGFNVGRFMFLDDQMSVGHKRIEEIASAILKEEVDIRWSTYLDVNLVASMKDPMLRFLAKSGLYALFMGLESGSQKILDTINKGITVEQTIEVNQRLKEYDIKPYYFAMAGFPGEMNEDLQKTIDIILKVLEDNPAARILAIHCFTPYCNTKMEEIAVLNGFKQPKALLEWNDFGGYKVIGPWISAERKKELEALMFLSNFIDGKLTDELDNRFLRLLVSRYRDIARYRFRNRDYRFMAFEIKLRDLYRFILETL